MPTPGAQTKMWMGSAVTNSSTCFLVDFLSESVKRRVGHIDGNALKGTRSRSKERIREGLRIVNGQVTWEPQTNDLAIMLPFILGASNSGTSYPLGETPSAFEIYKMFGTSAGSSPNTRFTTYAGCKVNQATFSATSGGLLRCTLDIVGLTATAAAYNDAGVPTVTLNTTTTLFTFHDVSTLTIGGNTFKLFDFSLTINNAMRPRWINSRDADAIYSTDRVVTISHNMPEDQTIVSAFEDVNVAVVITFTSSNQTLTFSMPAVRYDVDSIAVSGREETMMPLSGIAYKSGSSPELAVTLDSDPGA